jgi:hypothetical protein
VFAAAAAAAVHLATNAATHLFFSFEVVLFFLMCLLFLSSYHRLVLASCLIYFLPLGVM